MNFDCKNALLQNDNDVDKSIDWLRKKGLSVAAKKSGRVAAEGIVGVNIDKNQAVANKFSVRGIPTFILFQSNEIKWRKSGLLEENVLLAELKKIT